MPCLGKLRACLAKPREPNLTCQEGVVFNVSLLSGFPYLGLTGNCLNDKILVCKKHAKQKAQNSEIDKHVEDCKL